MQSWRNLFLIVALIAAAALYSQSRESAVGSPVEPPDPTGARVRFRTQQVTHEIVTSTIEPTGTLKAWRKVSLLAATEGVATRLSADSTGAELQPGRFVRAGTPIVFINSTEFQLRLNIARAKRTSAEAERDQLSAGVRSEDLERLAARYQAARFRFDEARQDFERASRLAKHRSATTAELERRKAALKVAQAETTAAHAELERARFGATAEELAVIEAKIAETVAEVASLEHALSECVIRVPFDAVVSSVHVSPGQRVVPQQPVVEIVDLRKLIAVVRLDERHFGRVHVGDTANVRTAAAASQSGRILAIRPTIDPASRQFEVHIEIDNASGHMSAGQFAKMQIVTRSTQPVMTIHSASIVWNSGVPHVFEVRNGVIKRRPIHVREEVDGRVEVLAGLSPNAMIATSGVSSLVDGVAVINRSRDSESRTADVSQLAAR